MQLKVNLVIGFVLLSIVALAQMVTAPFRLVNSAYDEQCPVISPDGKTLYFTIANHPDNFGGKLDRGDIWVSQWMGDAWSVPVHGGSLINNGSYNAVAGFSADGNQLFLLSHYGKDGNDTTPQGIAVSYKNETGWLAPENISIPYFLNRSETLSGMMNADGTVFVFSADSYQTHGVEDIYVSFKKDNQWTEPLNLGLTINSKFQELTPSLSADGNTLFFSATGRSGWGGFDIYSSTRLDESWTSWSTPKNIGASPNAESRELYYRPMQQINLFTTTSNSDGYGDIRGVDVAEPLVSETKNSDSQKRTIVLGRITNSKTGAGIGVTLVFKSDSVYTVYSSAEGYYKISISSDKVYDIEVQALHFVSLAERLDLNATKVKPVLMDFQLQPIEVGAVVNLKNVLFTLGTTKLLDESYPQLNVVAEFLKSNKNVEIELEGHTDNRGDAKKNLILSQERVDKIKSYLVSKGISAKRIKGKGFGGTHPLSKDDNEEARKQNRRVEFVILKE